MYHICLDPGHGPGSANKSPDGLYEEQEFAMDLARRILPHLTRHGVQVTLTREETGYPGLAARCRTANLIPNLDLFVSLHSNAAGNSGWYEARGFLVYTSEAGEAARRNKAARAVLKEWAKLGLTLRNGGGLDHFGYTVLTSTTAPAILLEHGFHTSPSDVVMLRDPHFRAALALADAKGIVSYLGIPWQEEATAEADSKTPGDSKAPPQDAAPGDTQALLALRARVKARYGLEEQTLDYLAAYAYGSQLLEKLAKGGGAQ